MTAFADLAAETGTAVAVVSLLGGAAGWAAKRWVSDLVAQVVVEQRAMSKRTEQLEHNGGTHVADYARDSRDIGRQTLTAVESVNNRLTDHIIEAAEQRGAIKAQLDILLPRQR